MLRSTPRQQSIVTQLLRSRWLQPWEQIDWPLLWAVLLLTGIGGMFIRSTLLHSHMETDWKQHWVTGVVGLIMAMLVSRSRYEYLQQWTWWIYGITNVFLIAIRFVGRSELGAQSWISIGGFNVQPSEFAKVAVIIVMASILSIEPANTIGSMLRSLGVLVIPTGLIFVQPDLGTALVFGAIAIGMLYWANAKPGWLLLLLSPLVAAILFANSKPIWLIWTILMGLVGWRSLPWYRVGALASWLVNLASGPLIGQWAWSNVLKPHQRDRLSMFLDPTKDALGAGYHLIQSQIAIGSGGLWGKGLNQGSQTQLEFIPEQHTDFIFSAVGEELGFLGGFFVVLVFWFVCVRLVLIAQNARDDFGSLLAIGVLSMIIFQVLVNIGMTIGVSPVTGIPLPWLSYGRSALLTNFLALGIVESVANGRQRFRS
jgi:rod shape determining protein RodA